MKRIYFLLMAVCLSLVSFAQNEAIIANFEAGNDGFAVGWGSGTASVVVNPSGTTDVVNSSPKVMRYTGDAWTGLSKWFNNADAFLASYTAVEFDVYVPELISGSATVNVVGSSSKASPDNKVTYTNGYNVTTANAWVHVKLDVTNNSTYDFQQFYFQSNVKDFYVDNVKFISNTTVNSISFVSNPPTSVNSNQEVSFEIAYTVAQESKIKACLTLYDGYTWKGDIVAAYFDEAGPSTSTILKTVTLKIPTDIVLSSALASGAYKWELGISNPTWSVGYGGLKAAVVVETATALETIEGLKYSIYSNQGVLNVMDAEGSKIEIYSLAGSLISGTANAGSLFASSVTSGVYIVVVDGITSKIVVK